MATRAALLLVAVLAAIAQGQPTNHPQTTPAPGRARPNATTPAGTTPPGATPAKPSDPGARTHDPSPVEFGEDPYKLDSAGLSMLLPLNSTAQSSSAGSKSAADIVGKDRTWMISIQTPRSSDPDTTTADVCDRIVTEYFRAAGELYDPKAPTQLAGVKGIILEARSPVTVDNQTADRVYFSVPGASPKDPVIVRGLTVIKNAANQFLIFELTTTQPAFARARAIYEMTVQTAHIEDPTKLNAERASAIVAGQRVMQSLGPNAVQELISATPERWERKYKPAPGGADADAKELGYRRIRTTTGTRAMLDTSGKNAVGAGNRQQGFILYMDARVLEGGYTVDSSAAFFLSPDANIDNSEEAWTVRNAIRKDGKTDTVTEIGARDGKSMVITVEGTGLTSRTVKPVFQGDGYISRVEAWLLPQLLVKAKVTSDFAFYSYQSEAGSVVLRRDALEQPADKPDCWKLTSKLGDDKKPQISYYNAKGELIRTELPDGSIWEPVALERLVQLWKSKNLPMK